MNKNIALLSLVIIMVLICFFMLIDVKFKITNDYSFDMDEHSIIDVELVEKNYLMTDVVMHRKWILFTLLNDEPFYVKELLTYSDHCQVNEDDASFFLVERFDYHVIELSIQCKLEKITLISNNQIYTYEVQHYHE